MQAGRGFYEESKIEIGQKIKKIFLGNVAHLTLYNSETHQICWYVCLLDKEHTHTKEWSKSEEKKPLCVGFNKIPIFTFLTLYSRTIHRGDKPKIQ